MAGPPRAGRTAHGRVRGRRDRARGARESFRTWIPYRLHRTDRRRHLGRGRGDLAGPGGPRDRRRARSRRCRGGQRAVAASVRAGPAGARRGRDRPGRRRVRRREHLRRRGGGSCVGRGGRRSRARRVPRRQHARRDGRAQVRQVPALRLGFRAAGRCRGLAGGQAHRRPRGRRRRRPAGRRARLAGGRLQASEPQRRARGGLVRGGARGAARRDPRVRGKGRAPAGTEREGPRRRGRGHRAGRTAVAARQLARVGCVCRRAAAEATGRNS